MSGPRVCFIVHEACRSGPPIYALHLVTWLTGNTDLDVGVVLLEGGPLEPGFAALCPTRVHATEPREAMMLLDRADLAYVNTAVSIRLLRETGRRPPVVLTHVHELEVGLSYWLPPADHEALLELTDRYLVGPDCAADNLVRNHGVPRDKIGQVRYFVPPGPPPSPDARPVRSQLHIDERTIVVGACGAREWRKAPDLFSYTAWEAHRLAPDLPLAFVWLGSPIPTGPQWDEEAELALLALGDSLQFVEDQPDPDPWLASYDVFALTSREDNFPLACLSACSFGVPVVAFDGGGIAELIRASGGGRVVPYPDVDAMAGEVVALAADTATRLEMGHRLRDHVVAHHQLHRCAAEVAAEIRELVG